MKQYPRPVAVVAGLPEEEWVDVDDAGKSMEGSCESAEAGCCFHEAHTNTEAGVQLSVPPMLGCKHTCMLTACHIHYIRVTA